MLCFLCFSFACCNHWYFLLRMTKIVQCHKMSFYLAHTHTNIQMTLNELLWMNGEKKNSKWRTTEKKRPNQRSVRFRATKVQNKWQEKSKIKTRIADNKRKIYKMNWNPRHIMLRVCVCVCLCYRYSFVANSWSGTAATAFSLASHVFLFFSSSSLTQCWVFASTYKFILLYIC